MTSTSSNPPEAIAPHDRYERLDGGIEGPALAVGAVRFHFIDALRGIAAILVLSFHLHHAFLETPLSAAAPHWLRAMMGRGFAGVDMFFVISGFVIAHSIREQRVGGQFLARFALRRSIRLDPLYWSAIAASALVAWKFHAKDPQQFPIPTIPLLVAHIAYVPEIFGYRYLSPVFWTLCQEIQLYVAFVLTIALLQLSARLIGRKSDPTGIHRLGRTEFLADVLLLSSAAVSAGAFANGFRTRGWFVEFWFMFALGALVMRACARKSSTVMLYLLCAFLLGCLVACEIPVLRMPIGTAVTTGMAIHVAHRAGGLTTWLRIAPLQWLGRISYSLYLWHSLVLLPLTLPGQQLANGPIGRSALVLILAVIASLLVAQTMYWTIERPSLRLAMRIKTRNP